MQEEPDLTRRLILGASAGLILPRWGWTQSRDREAFCWKLEERGDKARESIGGAEDAISSRTGHAIWVGEGRNRALRMDGYSVWFKHNFPVEALRGDAITIAAWVALESYPVNEAALLELESDSNRAFRFSIDRLGFLQFGLQRGDTKSLCKSSAPVGTSKWTHLAVSAGRSGTTLYQDGVPCGHLQSSIDSFKLADKAGFVVGEAPDCPMVADIFPTGVLNCLLRDMRVYSDELSRGAIAEIIADSRPDGPADLQINSPWCADDPHRPEYHALPPRAWTNEPHGLVYWRGQHHLFYQKNPNGPYWGHIYWGHMTSPDLHRWTEMPIALTPEPGPDQEGCWSGSAIVHEDKLALIYTGGDGTRSSICLAMSDDGITFARHPGNPIIPQPPQGFPEFRDPHVWREGDLYYMIIGSAVKDVGGTALLYRSRDLVTWEFRKPLLVGDHESSGIFWEMPIFVKLGDQHALIVCEVPGRASYWVGTWKDETFVPRSMTAQRLELFNHLLSPTPLTRADGTVLTMGIIPDERSPKECWRAGWAHLYSLPRVITADDRGRLHQAPYPEVEEWFEPAHTAMAITLADGAMQPVEASGFALNIRVVFKRMDSRSVTLRLRSSDDGREHTDIHYEWEIGRLVFDPSHSSLSQTVKKDRQEATYFPDSQGTLDLQVFLDHSVIEVFLDRRASFAARIYPTLEGSAGVALGSMGGAAQATTLSIGKLRRQV
jgi:sucrose-6-phosphate hydrolase SacC (GH32 family)